MYKCLNVRKCKKKVKSANCDSSDGNIPCTVEPQ